MVALVVLFLLTVASLIYPSSCLPSAAREAPQLHKDSRIGIVGAGPTGMHMAYLLNSLGFTNVVVLESSGRVGGRSVSLADDRQPEVTHEMGTCYMSSEYVDFRRMARHIEYAMDVVSLPKAVVRTGDGRQMELDRFIVDRVRRLNPDLSPGSTDAEVYQRIELAAWNYLKTRRDFFPPGRPDYLEFPVPRPSDGLMSRLNCTLRQFLVDNNLMPLEPFFLLGMTAMGYGSADDTSALYGMMWMTPAYLSDLLSQRNTSGLSLLRRGFQSFWSAARAFLDRRGGVEFRFNSRVTRVTRSATTVRLGLSDGTSETFDWLIWTPSVQSSAAAFDALTPAEMAAFAGLSSRKFRTRLVRLSGAQELGVAADPIAYYLDVLDGRPSLTRLLAVRNSAKTLLLTSSGAAEAAAEGPLAVRTSTLVAYYLSDYGDKIISGDRTTVADDQPDERVLDDGEVLADATFDYMPRYSVADMAGGALWRLLEDVQGANRTWFAGHSVVFDSVKSVMKYNKMLLLGAFPSLEGVLAEI